ncbi:hypothetical protein JCM19314_1351 [Nonlabens ulvanivorans]|uniref:Uncharacterized protein n=1 Tax=Nonlabens ulvanivorans TaxID=906888 RepID=A0A090QH61_NONUL|nr:hypothetical protein JCM19314_1351 [Nonlabens ulvanivorans]
MFDGVQVATGTQVNEGLPPFYNAFFNPSFSFIELVKQTLVSFLQMILQTVLAAALFGILEILLAV